MANNFSDDMQEPTIRLTRKQLLELEVSETLVDLLTFSGVQSNNTDPPEPNIRLTRKQLLALRVPETLVDLLTFSNVQSNEPALSVDRISAGDQAGPRSAIDMIQTEVKLNDLPELPFELILSYLSLEDRIKSRAVSRRWYNVINGFRPKSHCYSDRPIGFIHEKNRWVIGAFAQNFISSTKFGPFFQTFGQSIFANLKHFRLCKLDLNAENTPASFVQILNSFGQLEELDLFDIDRSSELGAYFQVRLYLPMLKSIQIRSVNAIEKLTLDAPRLENVKLLYCSDLAMELVHCESVEKLTIDRLHMMKVSKMKNLKYLYCGLSLRIHSTLLSTLEHLNEIHLHSEDHVSNLFQQKAQYGRSNLKIFLRGCLLNAPDDPAIESLGYWSGRYLVCLAENPLKAAKEMPIHFGLCYSEIEAVAPGLEIDILKRFTDLCSITAYEPVQDVDRFLELLKNLNNTVKLDFYNSDQPQELFDRLPDHCAIQELEIRKAPADLDFIFKLKSLIELHLLFPIDIDLVPRVLEELPFLSTFGFEYLNEYFKIIIDHSKQFTILFGYRGGTKVSDVNAVVQWIREKARRRRILKMPNRMMKNLKMKIVSHLNRW